MNQDRQIAPNRKSRAEIRRSNQRQELKGHFKDLNSMDMIEGTKTSYAIMRSRGMRALNVSFMKRRTAFPHATYSGEMKQPTLKIQPEKQSATPLNHQSLLHRIQHTLDLHHYEYQRVSHVIDTRELWSLAITESNRKIGGGGQLLCGLWPGKDTMTWKLTRY